MKHKGMLRKTCLDCMHLHFRMVELWDDTYEMDVDASEIRCEKGKWRMVAGDMEGDFVSKMRSAQSCGDFERI